MTQIAHIIFRHSGETYDAKLGLNKNDKDYNFFNFAHFEFICRSKKYSYKKADQFTFIDNNRTITSKTSETIGDIFNDTDTITLDVNVITYADGKVYVTT